MTMFPQGYSLGRLANAIDRLNARLARLEKATQDWTMEAARPPLINDPAVPLSERRLRQASNGWWYAVGPDGVDINKGGLRNRVEALALLDQEIAA